MIANQLKMPSFAGIQNANTLLRSYLIETPLVKSHLLSEILNADIWLKIESASQINSFKARGALTSLLRCENPREKIAVTSSTGNHGQGVAYASQLLGWQAHIFLPNKTNPLKRQKISALGAQIHDMGKDIDEAKEFAKEFCQSNQGVFVDDGESLDVMEGAGTVGLEIGNKLSHIDYLLVPMGSGTLATGCATAIKHLQPRCEVIAVQASGSPAMYLSYHNKKHTEHPVDTIAEGLACRVPAQLALQALLHLIDDCWLVEESILLKAVNTLAKKAQILTEPAGASPLAAHFVNSELFKNTRVVLVLSGSNISENIFELAFSADPLF